MVSAGIQKKSSIEPAAKPCNQCDQAGNVFNAGKIYTVNVTGVDGRVVSRASGDINQVNSQLNNSVGTSEPGMYIPPECR